MSVGFLAQTINTCSEFLNRTLRASQVDIFLEREIKWNSPLDLV